MPKFLCVACSTQYPESDEPPVVCPICQDERQYVPHDVGQRWTTLEQLRETHRPVFREELPGLLGIGTDPSFAIGQRALLVDGVLWDCQALLDDEIAERIGRLDAIAISHPHYYSTMVDWAERFECPVFLHADDREWVMRPDPRIEFWDGEQLELKPGLTLVRAGGHYPGGNVLHWAAGDALLSGDIVQVIPDRQWVAFMWSYPNLIPLPADEVLRLAERLEPWPFERIVGAWFDRIVPRDGSAIVRRSAARYAARVGSDPATDV
jgi:glyoxylase-like metal-dependent hydrolase (beta-lactamase superfamily II)